MAWIGLPARIKPFDCKADHSSVLFGFICRQSGHEIDNEVAVFILKHTHVTHVTHGNGCNIPSNDFQTGNTFTDFGQDLLSQALNRGLIDPTVIAIGEQQRDFGQREAEFLQVHDGLETVQGVAAILAITGFGSTLWRNQNRCLIQTQLTPVTLAALHNAQVVCSDLKALMTVFIFCWFGTPVPSQGVSPILIKTIKSLDMAPRCRVFNLPISKTPLEIYLGDTPQSPQNCTRHWRRLRHRHGAGSSRCARRRPTRVGNPQRCQ